MRLIDADELMKSAGLFEITMMARGCGKSILHLAKAWLFSEVRKAPTIEVEIVTHSRWVKDRDGDEYCENCCRYMPAREVTGDPSAINYCPNCGAKMDN